MEYGAHLPLVDFGGGPPGVAELRSYARHAAELGYRFLCANDHLVFRRPWLDGLAALAATIDASADMTLATTACLPAVRGPAPTAKALAAIDILSGGRVVAGVGPGSSARDYDLVGLDFAERWKRFDETIRALRRLLGELEPRPGRIPIWVASWGSPAGLRRVARLGDGWLASGYNTTPDRFAAGAAGLPQGFPNGIATMWLHVTEDRGGDERTLADVLAPFLDRPLEAVRELALPIGSAEQCAERIRAFRDAGAQRIFVWPLMDDLRQLELFMERVVPLV